MIKVDLHTHSEASIDGGITADQYASLLDDEELDVIAITDHNRIDFALGMQKALGPDRIIVGEEIMTTKGEIIGLFLDRKIEPYQSPQATIDAIKIQNGLVYIPHPFENIRKGISEDLITALSVDIDIIEAFNGRSFSGNANANKIQSVAKRHNILIASSSDAHGVKGVGRTYLAFSRIPNRKDFLHLLSSAQLHYKKPPAIAYLYPKINKFINTLKARAN